MNLTMNVDRFRIPDLAIAGERIRIEYFVVERRTCYDDVTLFFRDLNVDLRRRY